MRETETNSSNKLSKTNHGRRTGMVYFKNDTKLQQGSYRIFYIVFPEVLMISTHFPLSFLIKIDMFSLSLLFVNHMKYECCAGGTTCNDLPAAGDLGGTLSSRDPTAYIRQKLPKIRPRGPFTLNYNFVNFVD